jgi:hypothetical protein
VCGEEAILLLDEALILTKLLFIIEPITCIRQVCSVVDKFGVDVLVIKLLGLLTIIFYGQVLQQG